MSEVPVAGSAGRSITVRVGGGPATVLSAGSRVGAASMPVDVVIVFDTTGSMDTKIDGLVACAVAMVSALAQSGLDWRLTAVPFGDLMVVGDTIETELPWCSDAVAAERSLRTMRRNAGGGNAGESSFEALLAGVRKAGREGALRVVLLVTDEPPHTHTIKPAAMVDQLRQRDVLCNVISPDLAAFRSLAQATGGTWLQIGASVDMRSLIAAWSRLGGQIADRAEAVVRLGGSPQRALALEAGR